MDSFDVKVAGGEKIRGKGCSRRVQWSQKSETDLLVMSLGEPHIVLGTVRLKSLGPTIWYFSKHTMKYWRKDRAVRLQGVQFSRVDVVNGELFDKMLAYKLIADVVQMENEPSVQVNEYARGPPTVVA